MGSFLAKTITTVIMWIVLGAVATIAMTNSVFLEDWAVVATTIAPLTMALIGTFLIWVAGDLINRNRDEEQSKSKRAPQPPQQRDDLSTLMSLMSRAEQEAFKEILKQRVLDNMRDGELPMDADILWHEDEQQRRRS